MKIHAIQTGTVAVTENWRGGVGRGRRRLLHTIRDSEWTEPLPIYAFVIEHPEGVIVVDTGETARATRPGYFPRIAVLVDEGERAVFLAGDSSYTEDLMLHGKPDGVGADDDDERLTHERILTYAAEHPTVYRVAHDPDTGVRLAERRLVQPVPIEVAA